jgi:hypothetical protein
LLLAVDVGTSPPEVDAVAGIVDVAKLELESEEAADEETIVDPPPLLPPMPVPDSVGLAGEEAETSLVVDGVIVGLRDEEVEVSVVIADTVVDPSLVNSFAAVRLI